MIKRSELKKNARHVLKQHYWLLVLVCVASTFIGGNNSAMTTALEIQSNIGAPSDEGQSTSGTLSETDENGNTISTGSFASQIDANAVFQDLISGNTAAGKETADSLKKDDQASGTKALGRSRGVLATAINEISSGSIYVTILAGIHSIVKSESVAIIFFILGSIVVLLFVWVFIQNIIDVVAARIFLESRAYEKVPPSRFVFLIHVKRWAKVAWDMLVLFVFKFLWMLTIVGGIIKLYSYRMVPYILAENPDMKACQAITLSRRMMNGHKWECFVLDLTFLGWYILGYITLGLTDVFYYAPYKAATFAEYYTELRRIGIESKIDGCEGFNDVYLFEKADSATLLAAYPEAAALIAESAPKVESKKGFLGFIANVFGIILVNDAQEQAYEEDQQRLVRIGFYKGYLDGSRYPVRLFPIPEKEKYKRTESTNYMRRYSIWSLVLLFFIFSLIGWVWEVSLHMISDGVFVNRGVLQGPWLPIYGTGGIVILVFLYRLRKSPVAEFIAAVVLSGCVEYFTSWYLQMVHNGQRWWDYSGYFLNINGRICAEGLLVFGLGGFAIVYIVAPLLDNHIRRIKPKVLIPICLILICLFTTDNLYSSKHPNTGKGITDYSSMIDTRQKQGAYPFLSHWHS